MNITDCQLPSTQYGFWLPVLEPSYHDGIKRVLEWKLARLRGELEDEGYTLSEPQWIEHGADTEMDLPATLGWKFSIEYSLTPNG